MYEHVTEPFQPRPIETFKAVQAPPVARWILHKARRSRVGERFGDLQCHPWVGERQAGFSRGLYANNVRMVDQELRKVPYPQRLANPASGAYPLVQGIETGTGPHPWVDKTDEAYITVAHGRRTPYFGKGQPIKVPVDKDVANVATGPASTHPGIYVPRRRHSTGGALRMAAAGVARTAASGALATGGYAAGAAAGAALGPIGSAALGGAGAAVGGRLATTMFG